MGYIDVAIPLLGGILCVLFPRAMTKNAAPAAISRIRKIGLMLLGVAALYLIIKVFGR